MLACNLPAARILVVEDDPLLAAHLQRSLSESGYQVVLCKNGEEGLRQARQGCFDLVLQDILLPGISGLDALHQLREDRSVPVILMSALGEEQDRIAGFTGGADDYLPKPFSMAELQVRVEAVLRRVAYERTEPANLNSDPQLVFDERRTDVSMNGAWAELTSTEYRVLEALMRDQGEVLTKAFLYQQVLHRAYSRHDRSLDMHVSHIRRKLQVIGYTAGRIDTVWGKGYVFTRLTV